MEWFSHCKWYTVPVLPACVIIYLFNMPYFIPFSPSSFFHLWNTACTDSSFILKSLYLRLNSPVWLTSWPMESITCFLTTRNPILTQRQVSASLSFVYAYPFDWICHCGELDSHLGCYKQGLLLDFLSNRILYLWYLPLYAAPRRYDQTPGRLFP